MQDLSQIQREKQMTDAKYTECAAAEYALRLLLQRLRRRAAKRAPFSIR